MGKPSKKKRKWFYQDERYRLVAGSFLIVFSLYLLLSFISYLFTWKVDQSFEWSDLFSDATIQVENWSGKSGAYFSSLFLYHWFGISSFMLPFMLIIIGLRYLNINIAPAGKTLRITIVAIILGSVTLGYLFGDGNGYLGSGLGGSHGYFLSRWMNAFLGKAGTAFVLVIAFLSFILFSINLALDRIRNLLNSSLSWRKKVIEDEPRHSTDEILVDESVLETFEVHNVEEESDTGNEEVLKDEVPDQEPKVTEVDDVLPEQVGISDNDIELTVEKKRDGNDVGSDEVPPQDINYDPTLDLSNYRFPNLQMLEEHDAGNTEVSNEELIGNKNRIVETLANYKIQIDKIKATIGPTVTLYEIVPAPGVRISKIKNLEDDIALSLSALGIRIIAPIPGRGTIGIEVPNRNPEIVSLRSVLSSKKFQESDYELAIALGKTISNETYTIDLTRMPHILVAGATGQGKSVGLNVIISSLLYKMHPSQLKFVFIDPKKVELTLYSRIEKHFLATLPDVEEPIITDTQSVINTLNSMTIEMDQRYNLLKKAQVRNIKEYNEKFVSRKLNPNKGHRFLPYIVLVIDEFADLIMTAGREVEVPLTRLAQLARAIGIHLIIATQRPTTNIITGVIKANFPARIAFRVTAMVDSRTILDSPGANQLVGRGDMLYSFGSDLIRLQCAFVDIKEIDKITDWIHQQQGFPTAFILPEYIDESKTDLEDIDLDRRDPLFEEAARIVVINQQGSTSLIQRKLSIGYNRAGRIIDQLEAAGVVGPFEGSKARRVLFPDEFSLEQFLKNDTIEPLDNP